MNLRPIPFLFFLFCLALLPRLSAAEEVPAEGGRGYLGITAVRADPATTEGVVVQNVFPGTTAAEMGLVRGDVITRLGEAGVRTREQLVAALDDVSVGDEFELTVQRGEQELTLTGILKGKMPAVGRVFEQMRREQERIRELREQRSELRRGRDEVTLADAMQQLARALEEFPTKLQAAAEQFKKVYPDGKFTIRVEIDIQSDAEADAVVELDPAAMAPDPDAEPEVPEEPEPEDPDPEQPEPEDPMPEAEQAP